jgi:hypothetical protein
MAIKVKGARDILGSLPKAATKTSYDPAQQTQGYLRRLEGAGVDIEKAKDPRNFVEKALNLRPDQNLLFDVFEVINRPQQALFGAFKAAQEGNKIGEAFLKGLSGKEETRFKDILVNAGLDEESFFTKALGFAGDVFLDPVDWALLPVTATLAGIDTVADAARIVKTSGFADEVIAGAKAAKTLRIKDADDIVNITQKGLEAKRLIDAGNDTKKVAKQYERFQKLQEVVNNTVKGKKYLTRGSALGVTARGAKSGIIKLAGLTDETIIKGLTAIDKANNIRFKEGTLTSFKDIVLQSGDSAKSLALKYFSLKNTLGGVFDIASKLPDRVLAAIRKASGDASITKRALEESSSKANKIIQEAAEKGVGGSTVEEVRKNVLNFIEWFYRKTPSKTTVDNLVNGGFSFNEKNFNKLAKLIKKYSNGAIDLTTSSIGQGVIVQGSGKVKRYFFDESLTNRLRDLIEQNLELANTKLTKSTFYTPEATQVMEALQKDEAFMKMFNEVDPIYSKFQRALSVFQDQAKLEGFTESGYVRHVFNRDFGDLNKLAQEGDTAAREVTEIIQGIKYGNTKAVAQRKWQMSALEANTIVRENIITKLSDPTVELSDEARKILTDLSTRDMFVESIQASVDDWIAEIPKLVKNGNIIDEVLVKSIIKKSDDGILSIDPSKDIVVINYKGKDIPRGYEEIAVGQLKQKLEELLKVIESPEMEKLVKELGENGALANAKVAIDQHVFGMLNFINDPSGTGLMLDLVDQSNNVFKRFKLLSAGFHVRNIVGNFTNSMLVGMPFGQVPVYFRKAMKTIDEGAAAVKKVTEAGTEAVLTASERTSYNLFRKFVNEGFSDISSEIYDLGADVVGKNVDLFTAKGLGKKAEGLLQLNNKANEYMDLRYRLGLYMYAMDNPQIARNIGLETPGDVVRRALFDPKATSRAERETIKRIVPFYTFAKKNLAYQIRNIFDNPVRYNRLQKSVRGLWDIEGISVDDIEDYKKENFWIPVPGLTKDGKYTAVKANLPIGDLAEWFENPLVKGVSSLTPLVRAPFELATGVQTFTGRPIQDFPGQKGYVFPNIPRNIEYLIGQTGIDVPVAAVRNIGQTGAKLLQITGEEMPTIAEAVPSAFSAGDLARAQTGRDYDELARVRDLYNYYKQELGEIPTIAEIENKNNNQLKIASRLDGLLK